MSKAKGRPAGSRPLGDWVDGCLAPALARYGFGEADIITAWLDIAGQRVAAMSEPVEIKWPRGATKHGATLDAARRPATLVLRVESMFAIELQHLAPLLIERINAHLGWRCIGRIALRQAPLQGRPPPRSLPLPPAPDALRRASAVVGAIEDEGLRLALVRLGARALKPG